MRECTPLPFPSACPSHDDDDDDADDDDWWCGGEKVPAGRTPPNCVCARARARRTKRWLADGNGDLCLLLGLRDARVFDNDDYTTTMTPTTTTVEIAIFKCAYPSSQTSPFPWLLARTRLGMPVAAAAVVPGESYKVFPSPLPKISILLEFLLRHCTFIVYAFLLLKYRCHTIRLRPSITISSLLSLVTSQAFNDL